jgi:putative ABC transport system permease protein
MLKNYLKIAFRHLWRNKFYSFLNLFGFSVGMVSVMLLYFYVKGELAYDSFHTQKDKIYRVLRQSEINGEKYFIGVTSGPYAKALKQDFSEINKVTRVMPDEALIHHKNQGIREKKFFYADANFFEFFSFPLLHGSPREVLKNGNSVVLTKATAKRYFGKENPIGKLLKLNNQQTLLITGVVDIPPAKSHLDFDFVASISIMESQEWFKGWWANGLCTYVKIDSPAKARDLVQKFPKFMDKYFGKDFVANNNRIDLDLQALSKVYFDYQVRYDPVKHGNLTTVNILGAVGLAILVIACFNYINLAIAFSFRRGKEVGIRKVLGSFRRLLLFQFLTESALIVGMALILSASATELILPIFNQYFATDIAINWWQIESLAFLISLILLTSIISGFYPAFLISGFSPLKALKGNLKIAGFSVWVRKCLVISQFGISVFMMIFTLLIIMQLNFLKTQDMGFQKEAVVLLQTPRSIREKMDAFRNELSQYSAVMNTSTASGEPGGFHDATSIDIDGKDSEHRLRIAFVDEKYIETYGLKLVNGRNFSKNIASDTSQALILNETAIKKLGWTAEEALNKKIHLEYFDSLPRKVVGVVKDYHFASLKEKIEPLVLSMSHRNWILAVKLAPNQLSAGLDNIQKTWQKFAPESPFEYRFLDDSFFSLYENEQKQEKVFMVFAVLSILLACLGIFGLASFNTEQRKKEIGIRKVLGASVSQIIFLISQDFLVLVFWAFVLSSPIAWYFVHQWLQDFAYRVELSGALFIIPGFIALVISFLTIIYQALKAGHTNPVDALRNE